MAVKGANHSPRGATKIVLFVSEALTITSLMSKHSLSFYSDAETTTINGENISDASFSLSVSNTSVSFNHFDNKMKDVKMEITGAQDIMFNNSIIKDMRLITDLVGKVKFYSSHVSNVTWRATSVKELQLFEASRVDVDLGSHTCIDREETYNFCTDTKLTVSNSSTFTNMEAPLKNGYLNQEGFEHFWEEAKMKIPYGTPPCNGWKDAKCFSVEQYNRFLTSCRYNQARQIKQTAIQMNALSEEVPLEKCLLEAFTSNAIYSIEYLMNDMSSMENIWTIWPITTIWKSNNVSGSGRNPLHLAARNNNVDLARTILRLGVDPNIRDLEYGSSPLHYAAEANSYEVARLLIDKGADKWAMMKYSGAQAIHLAAKFNNVRILELLVNEGVSVDEPNL